MIILSYLLAFAVVAFLTLAVASIVGLFALSVIHIVKKVRDKHVR